MTPAAKKPVGETQWRMRESLREMAARGTEHEAKIAREKLSLLEAKYDFEGASAPQEKDWFEDWPKAGGGAHSKLQPVLKIDPAWMDVGNVVKWVFAARLKVPTKWKMGAASVELGIGVHAKEVRSFKPLANKLYKNVVRVTQEFYQGLGRQHVGELERAPFIDGIADGLSGEVRQAGTMTPGRSPQPLPKKRGKSSAPSKVKPSASVRHTAVHPYDLGLEIGKRIRFKEDLPELVQAVRAALVEGEGQRMQESETS